MFSDAPINDCHCHFFSRHFFQTLAREKGIQTSPDPVDEITELLGWENPGSSADLAERWVQELDKNKTSRAALIASVPGDEESVAAALAKYPERFVGFFMVDPSQKGTPERIRWAVGELGLRCVCLFPAMHQFHLYQDRASEVFETATSLKETVVFVHCGVLSVGVRKKLGLSSRFAMRLSSPLDLHSVALSYPELPIIIPHFGAGLFREALMVADLCPNIYLDTSSSNSWIKYYPSLTLEDVFRQALEVVGPDRLLFGTDSSFFPRGWQRSVWENQMAVLERIGADDPTKAKFLSGNFNGLFPLRNS
ncbi:amidohydrolase family protein [Acidobacteria bacterium AH-259-D05]|nr:amidohydrolase family protein [Acidobacteria bacterium AH-259-D05]